jgi:hypothetical protein
MALLVLCFLILVPSVVSAATQPSAASAVASAQSLLVSCYNAAKAAEAAGANITVLQTALDSAGESLSNAQLAYSNGDYGASVNYAGQCQSALSGFVTKADALRASGEQQQGQDMAVFVGSVVGALVVVGAGWVVWVQLKKKYAS